MLVFRQFGSFAMVGFVATAIHASVALASHDYASLTPLMANFAGYVCAVTVSYFGNAWLTFRRPSANAGQFIRFVIISLLALGLNQLIVAYCTHILEWPFVGALALVVAVVPLFTFAVSKLWAFSDSTRLSAR